MNKKSTTPVANNISWCVPAAYPISSAIFVVSGLALSSNDVGIAVELPATKITAIVSPNALPIPSITPANIPDLAAGTVTLNIVSIFDAPSAKDPSLYAFGTALIDVSDKDIIVGSIIIDNTMITAYKLCPLGRLNTVCMAGTITAKPNIP